MSGSRNLNPIFDTFGKTLQQDGSIDATYGVIGGALLWAVRDAENHPDQHAELHRAVGDPHTETFLDLVIDWEDFTQTQAAKALSRRATRTESNPARDALNALIAHFITELRDLGAMQPGTDSRTYTVHGNITAANVNVGGTQYIIGSVFNQYTINENVQSCPTAPNPPKHFTGRKAELDILKTQLLSHEAVAITAVKSMGGMGKTALAKALCHQPDNPFPTVLWADVTQTPNVLSTLQTWAEHADSNFTLPTDPSTTPEQVADRVRGLLTELIAKRCGSPVLMVLDDVWESSYAAVEILQRAAPVGAHLLITTRHDTVVREFSAKALDLQILSEADSITLFQKLRDNPHLTDAHLERAARLIQGHPLTLELAAASLNSAEDAQDADDILNDYERGIRDGSPFDALNLQSETPRVLNVVFGRSYTHLPENNQRHFRTLGVFASDATWTREMAGSVWELTERRPLTDAHKTLRQAAFIAQTPTADGEAVRYSQHPLLRAYARALLADAGELETAFGRYADYVIEQATQFQTLPLEAWDSLEPLEPHVQAVGDELAQQWEASKNDDELKRRGEAFAYHVKQYVFHRPKPIETDSGISMRGMRWLMVGLDVSHQNKNEKRQALFCNEIGLAWDALGEKRKALEYYDKALPLRRAVGDRGGEATTLNNIGLAWDALGEKRKALEYYDKALPLRRAVGDRGGEATTLNNIGSAWSELGERRKALEYFDKALPLQRAVSDRGGEATTLNNIGLAWDALGEKRKALEYYDKALPLQRAVGNRGGEATTLNNMGGAWSALGEKRKALEYFDKALPLQRAVGNRGGEAGTLNNMGGAWSALGEKRKALEYFDKALPLQRAVGDRGGEAGTLNSIGSAWSALGEKRKALEYFDKALPLQRAVGDRGGEAGTLNNMGGAWSELGERRKALEYYDKALPLYRAVGDRGGEATTLNNMGGAWSELGEKRKALEYYEEALPLQRAVGDRGGEATTLNNIGLAWSALGEKWKALEYYEEALPLRRAVGDRGGEATTLNNIGLAWSALGEKWKALEYYEEALPLQRAVDDRNGEAITLFNMSFLVDDVSQTIEMVQKAHDLWSAIGSPYVAQYAAPRLAALRGGSSPQSQANPAMAAIQAFLNTSNLAEARQVYEANETVLSSPEVEAIFDQNIANSDDEEWKSHLQAHLARIRRAKIEGVEAAFAEEAPSQEEQLSQLLGLVASADEPTLQQIAEQVNPQVINLLAGLVADQLDDADLLARLHKIQAMQADD